MAKQAGRLRKLLRYHGKASGTPSQAAAEGFAVQRPSKAAAGLLRLLRGAQNVPRSSFKPNRNSLWGLGRYHGKAGGTPSQAAAEGFASQRPSKAAAGLLKLFKGCPKRAT